MSNYLPVACAHFATDSEGRCLMCRELIRVVESRTCGACGHAMSHGPHGIGGWTCGKHVMAIVPQMHTTYVASQGSCFAPRDVTD